MSQAQRFPGGSQTPVHTRFNFTGEEMDTVWADPGLSANGAAREFSLFKWHERLQGTLTHPSHLFLRSTHTRYLQWEAKGLTLKGDTGYLHKVINEFNTLRWLTSRFSIKWWPGCFLQWRQGVTSQHTSGNFSVLTETPTKGEGDIGQVHGRIWEALGAAICSRTSHGLWGLGARERVRLRPLPGARVRFTVGSGWGEKICLIATSLYS